MITVEELKAMLSGETLDVDGIVEAYVGAVEEEKQKGIKFYKDKDNEVLKYKSLVKEQEAKSTTSTTDAQLQINTLTEKVEGLMASLTSEREAKSAIEKKAKTKTLEAELIGKIGDKFYGSQYMIKDLINSGTVDINDEGTPYFKDGDNVVTLDKGIELLKERNKDMLKITQVSGSGDAGGKTDSTKLMDKPTDQVLKELGLIR